MTLQSVFNINFLKKMFVDWDDFKTKAGKYEYEYVQKILYSRVD